MIWSSWSEFLAMGGYGLYVWGSMAMTAIALAIEIAALRRRRRALFDQSALHGTQEDETTA